MTNAIILISAIVGIIVGFFIILDRIITIKKSKPILDFNIGLTPVFGSEKDFLVKVKKGSYKISTLFLGAEIESNSQWMFGCPYLLVNNSKLPIQNITIILEYSIKYSIKNDTIVKDDKGNKLWGLLDPKEIYNRDIQIQNSTASVRYTVPVLRPGEKVYLFDPLKFEEGISSSEHFECKGLLNTLQEINKFKDFCKIDVIVISESCPPISKRIKLLWFGTNSIKELLSLADASIIAFWGGKYPRGLYFRTHNIFKRRKHISTKEFAEIIVPKLDTIRVSKDKNFHFWSDPTDFEASSLLMNMPTWNYYQLSGDYSTDNLLRNQGFIKLT